MKGKGTYNLWLITELGLNRRTVYANQTAENQPEFMPLDNLLSTDI